MANELRVRALAVGGLIEDNPLSGAATALTSAGLAAAPAIGATQHLAIVLDPDGLNGAPEVAWVTAHTAGATTATIARGQEGTVARSHDRDVPWIHGATLWDFERPRVRCRRASDTASLAQNTWTTISWDAEDIDTHAMHDPASPTRVTIQRAGDYRIVSNVLINDNAAWGVRLLKNGAAGAVGGTVLPFISAGNATAAGAGGTISTLLRCVVGDYFEVQVIDYSAATHEVESDYSFFEVVLETMGEL